MAILQRLDRGLSGLEVRVHDNLFNSCYVFCQIYMHCLSVANMRYRIDENTKEISYCIYLGGRFFLDDRYTASTNLAVAFLNMERVQGVYCCNCCPRVHI